MADLSEEIKPKATLSLAQAPAGAQISAHVSILGLAHIATFCDWWNDAAGGWQKLAPSIVDGQKVWILDPQQLGALQGQWFNWLISASEQLGNDVVLSVHISLLANGKAIDSKDANVSLPKKTTKVFEWNFQVN